MDSRNKLLKKELGRRREGEKNWRRGSNSGSGSRLLRSSSASDNKSELRPHAHVDTMAS